MLFILEGLFPVYDYCLCHQSINTYIHILLLITHVIAAFLLGVCPNVRYDLLCSDTMGRSRITRIALRTEVHKCISDYV